MNTKLLTIAGFILYGITHHHHAHPMDYSPPQRLSQPVQSAKLRIGHSCPSPRREIMKARYKVENAPVPQNFNPLLATAEQQATASVRLFAAIKSGDCATVDHIAQRYNAGSTHAPVMLKDSHASQEFYELLANCGNIMNNTNPENLTPLMQAIITPMEAHKRYHITRTLIVNKANVNATTEELVTPLILASKYDCFDVARMLINCGANTTHRDMKHKSSWCYASQEIRKLIKEARTKNTRCTFAEKNRKTTARMWQEREKQQDIELQLPAHAIHHQEPMVIAMPD